MGLIGPSLILLTYNILVGASPARTITNCFISDFDKAELTYTYSEEGSSVGDLLLTVEFNDVAATSAFTIAESAPTNPSMMDNYVITDSCNSNFRLCKAHVGILYNIDIRKEIAKGDGIVSLMLEDSNQASNESCKIDGRNLDIMPPPPTDTTSTSEHTLNTGFDGDTATPFSFPVDGVLQGILPDSEMLVKGIRFTYTSGGAVQTLGSAAGYESEITFTASSVKKVETYLDTEGGFCGLVLKSDAGDVLVNTTGCPNGSPDTPHVDIDIPTDYQLAGFMQYDNGTEPHILVPVLYQRLSPKVMFYQWMEESLELTVKSFFGVVSLSYNYTLMTGLKSDGSGIETTSSTGVELTVSEAEAFSDVTTITPSDTSCGCYPVTVTFNVENGADNFTYQPSSPFVAWPVGYENDESMTLTFGNTTMSEESGSTYKTYSVPTSEMCPEMYPRKYSTRGFWLDGWLVDAPASEVVPTTTEDIAQRIISVEVIGSGTIVTGLKLTLVDDSILSVGDVAGDSLDTLEAPANSYLMSLKASVYDQGVVEGLTASFGKPKSPCYVMTMAADNYNDDLANADMRKVFWYDPVGYSQVVANISGLFVASDSESLLAKVMPTTDMAFGRGEMYKANFYHLKPDQRYEFSLMGTVELSPELSLNSDHSDMGNFTTSDGLKLECTNENTPMFINRIDWSAIPEVEVIYEQSAGFLGGAGEVDTFDAMMAQEFPTDTYFHYMSGQSPSHPVFAEFRGYPYKVYLYRAGQDLCVAALALEFNWVIGTTYKVFIIGNSSLADSLGEPESHTFRAPVVNVTAGFANESTPAQCLTALGFTEDIEGSPSITCLKSNNTVSDLCTEGPIIAPDGSYMSSLTASFSESGAFIDLSVTWVSVDVPTLHGLDANCTLHLDQNFFDIRASAWNLTLDLMGNDTSCGTKYTVHDGSTNKLTYKQEVMRLRDSVSDPIQGENLRITRSNSWAVKTTCTYGAEGTVSSSFDTVGEETKMIAHMDDFMFSMTIYRDQSFTESYSTGSMPTFNIGEMIYLATMLHSDVEGYIVKNFGCYATESPAQEKGDKYYLLSTDDGCPSDPSFEWDDQSDSRKDAFHFDAFAWVDDQNAVSLETVYIHCTVKVCAADVNAATCNDRGKNCRSNRARREVADLLANGVTEKTVSLETPIFVKRREVEILAIHRDPVVIYNDQSMTVASLFSAFATFSFFCLLVIGYRVHKVRKGFYQLKNEGKTN